MNRANAEQICRSLAQAIAEVREVFRRKLQIPEIHKRFWCVQDQLSRVLEAASDNPEEFFADQQIFHPLLFSDVVDVIAFASKVRFNDSAAVRQSCSAMNHLLMDITNLRMSVSKSRVASA